MKRIILTILLLLVALTYYNYDKKENEKTINNKDKTSINYKVEKKQNLIIETEKITKEEPANNSESFVTYIESVDKDVKTLTEKEKLTTLDKETLKNTFITLTDFIFYNGTIKGITFNELAEDAKNKIIIIYESIDSKIESVYPNYKENIKETTIKTYQNVSEKLIELKDSLVNNYKANIGEEKYNEQLDTLEESKETLKESFQPVIDEIVEESKKEYEKAKEEINNWYQTWKEEKN